mmetsp:Transcript_43179/g.102461  ORF Transcript_43179/g.102461 Transcript_43179/m.102461 type:complete len:435 (-) Transcript_43179:406-1710(-)
MLFLGENPQEGTRHLAVRGDHFVEALPLSLENRLVGCDGPLEGGHGRADASLEILILILWHGQRPLQELGEALLDLLPRDLGIRVVRPVEAVPPLVDVLLQREKLRQPHRGRERRDGVVECNHVVEPPVGHEEDLPGSDDLCDDGGLRHQRVLGDELVPREEEVDLAVDTVGVVQELLLVGADHPPQLPALDVHVEERGRVLVEGRDRSHGAEPVVRPGANVRLAHEPGEEGLHVADHPLELGALEHVVVGGEVVVVALPALDDHVDVLPEPDLAPQEVLVDLKVGVALAAHLHVDHLRAVPGLQLLGVPSILRENLPALDGEVGQDQGDGLAEVAFHQLLGRDGRPALDAVTLHADPAWEDVSSALGTGLVPASTWPADVVPFNRFLLRSRYVDVPADVVPSGAIDTGAARGTGNWEPFFLEVSRVYIRWASV